MTVIDLYQTEKESTGKTKDKSAKKRLYEFFLRFRDCVE